MVVEIVEKGRKAAALSVQFSAFLLRIRTKAGTGEQNTSYEQQAEEIARSVRAFYEIQNLKLKRNGCTTIKN